MYDSKGWTYGKTGRGEEELREPLKTRRRGERVSEIIESMDRKNEKEISLGKTGLERRQGRRERGKGEQAVKTKMEILN